MSIRMPKNGWAAYRRLCFPTAISRELELLLKHAFTAGMFVMKDIYFTAGLDETDAEWVNRLDLAEIELIEMVRESIDDVACGRS